MQLPEKKIAHVAERSKLRVLSYCGPKSTQWSLRRRNSKVDDWSFFFQGWNFLQSKNTKLGIRHFHPWKTKTSLSQSLCGWYVRSL